MVPPSVSEVQAVFPDWEIGSFAGKGTFKVAYKGVHQGRVEALKLFLVPEFEDDEGEEARTAFIGRFSREIRLLGECSSSSLVKLGTLQPKEVLIGSRKFIAYSEQFLEGETLDQTIKSGKLPTQEEVISLLTCLVSAITELWERHRCVHRDIKPGNLVKSSSAPSEFVLLDLGVSFDADGTRYTAAGVSPGTPVYRAPEMLDVDYADKLDARTDLYCAGVTVFEFAATVHPLAPFNVGSIEGRILNHPPARMHVARPDLPVWLCDIIDRLNRKRATLRGNLQLIRRELNLS